MWDKCCSERGDLIAACGKKRLLDRCWIDTFPRDLQCLNDQPLIDCVPPATTAYEMPTRRNERIKQPAAHVTCKQADLLTRLTYGLHDTDQHPRWKMQAPSGSGKTLLCVSMALFHFSKRVNVHRNLRGTSNTDERAVRDRFLLIAHSTALVEQCVDDLLGGTRNLVTERVANCSEETDWIELQARVGFQR